MNRRVWTLVFVLSISSLFTVRSAFPQGQTPSQRRAIDPPAKPTDSPVSLGMLVGDTLYISGRVGLDPKTGKVPDNLDDEMKNIFDDFKAELVQANMTKCVSPVSVTLCEKRQSVEALRTPPLLSFRRSDFHW
jgi:hypothetical protein